jgi:hypothetical protein
MLGPTIDCYTAVTPCGACSVYLPVGMGPRIAFFSVFFGGAGAILSTIGAIGSNRLPSVGPGFPGIATLHTVPGVARKG